MGLRNLVDKMKPTFSKGGKLSFLGSTFDAFETFLFVPNTTTTKGAHIRDCNDMKRTMIVVVMALIPALLFGMYNVGYQVGMTGFEAFWFGFLKVLPLIVVSYVVGLAIEFGFAQSRGHEVNEGFLVSGLLIPMIMPVDVPLWIVALATAFAVVFGKEVFGGTGMNVFNPALLARAFAFFAYTPQMSGEKVWYAAVDGADAVSGATALESLSPSGTLGVHAAVGGEPISACDAFLGLIPGSVGETSTLAILIGAAILLFTGIASWRTMLSVFVGGLAFGYLFNLLGVTSYPPYLHLIVGGFAFGAVFMATDPVTSAQTDKGKYIVGFMTGALAVIIRVCNRAYPEGMMLSILFMNALAPLVDYFVVERNMARRNRRIKTVNNRDMAMNKNSNAYIIIYTVVMVVIVATLLTFAATSLKERQDANAENEKKMAVMTALGKQGESFDETITPALLIDGVLTPQSDAKVVLDKLADLKTMASAENDLPLFKYTSARARRSMSYPWPAKASGAIYGAMWPCRPTATRSPAWYSTIRARLRVWVPRSLRPSIRSIT